MNLIEYGLTPTLIFSFTSEPPPHLSWSSPIALSPSVPKVTGSVSKSHLTVVASRRTVDQTISCTASNSSSTSSIAASKSVVDVTITVNRELTVLNCLIQLMIRSCCWLTFHDLLTIHSEPSPTDSMYISFKNFQLRIEGLYSTSHAFESCHA